MNVPTENAERTSMQLTMMKANVSKDLGGWTILRGIPLPLIVRA
jgi:hypothetical protein